MPDPKPWEPYLTTPEGPRAELPAVEIAGVQYRVHAAIKPKRRKR